MPLLFRLVEGKGGKVDIPDLGIHVGTIAWFRCVRRAPEGPEAEFYDLNAVFQSVTPSLFDDPDYEKRVILTPAKGRSWLVRPSEGPGQRTALNGRSLVMERVTLQRMEPDGNQNRSHQRP